MQDPFYWDDRSVLHPHRAANHALYGSFADATVIWNRKTAQGDRVLLGWDSKLVLIQKTAGGRQQYLANIRSEVHQLNLSLTHPVEYYFHYPVTDEGLRAQTFADETMALLKNVDPDIANHFGVAHNLLLSIRHTDLPEALRREELEELVQFLDIPADLKHKPEEGIVTWVDEIHQYFLSNAHRHVKTRLKVTGTSE